MGVYGAISGVLGSTEGTRGGKGSEGEHPGIIVLAVLPLGDDAAVMEVGHVSSPQLLQVGRPHVTLVSNSGVVLPLQGTYRPAQGGVLRPSARMPSAGN